MKIGRALNALRGHLDVWTEELEKGLASLKRVNEYGPNVGGESVDVEKLKWELSHYSSRTVNSAKVTMRVNRDTR